MKNNKEWKILKIIIGKLLVINKFSIVMLRIHIKKPPRIFGLQQNYHGTQMMWKELNIQIANKSSIQLQVFHIISGTRRICNTKKQSSELWSGIPMKSFPQLWALVPDEHKQLNSWK